MDNVTIQNNAFIFCRYSLAVLCWLALILRGDVGFWLIVTVFVIMTISVILKVNRSPLVWLWTNTLGRVIPSKSVVLDVAGMRFAHGLAAILSLIAISLIWRGSPAAWWVVAALALLKTLSAVSACPAYKLYSCVIKGGGTCCGFTRKR